jgi:type IV secretion system protein VirB5
MFRKGNQPVANVDDIVSVGQLDWHGRVNRAIASETAWKRCTYGCLGVIALLAGGVIYQAVHPAPPAVVHVVHNSMGGVIAVSAASNGSDTPTQVQIKAAVEQWVTNCRTIYVDINAMRRSLSSCAYTIEKGSQADMDMSRFYNNPHKEEPFFRAQTETVALEHVVGVPPTASDIGPKAMQTWQVTWMEHVTSRDGSFETVRPWAANVTLTIRPPTNVEDAQRDPDGIRIASYSWTEKN